MEDHHKEIDWQFNTESYITRLWKSTRLILLLYVFLLFLIFIKYNILDPVVLVTTFIFILIIIRHSYWVRYTPLSITTGKSGLNLIYLDRDNETSKQIKWADLAYYLRGTINKHPTKYIVINDKKMEVVSFYGRYELLDNERIIILYERLDELKNYYVNSPFQ